MPDPFDVTDTDIPADNGGISPDAWRNLMMFGASTMAAANQRDGNGLLTYGPGALGPIGAGIGQAGQLSMQAARARSQMGYQNAAMQELQNRIAMERTAQPYQLQLLGSQAAEAGARANLLGAQTPYAGQLAQADVAQRLAAANLAGQQAQFYGPLTQAQIGQMGAATGNTQQEMLNRALQNQLQTQMFNYRSGVIGGPQIQMPPGPVQVTGGAPVQQAIGGQESGNNAVAQNNFGFIGAYQFGAPAAADAGFYKPAPGENLYANEWKGTFTVPGFAPMNKDQFLANPDAQKAAYMQHQQALVGQLNANGSTQYIGQTVGGVPINPVTLAALGHVAGAGGAHQFLASGGQVDPVVGTGGMHASQYATGVFQRYQQQQNSINGMSPPQAAMYYYTHQSDVTPEIAGRIQPYAQMLDPEWAKSLQGLAAEPQQEANKGRDVRPGGMYVGPLASQGGQVGELKNPELREVESPTGEKSYVWATPPSAGEKGPNLTPATAAPGGTNVAQIPESAQITRREFATKENESYEGAVNTQGWLEQMEHAVDQIGNGGFLGIGPTSHVRTQIAATGNDFLRSLGLPEAFDANKIANYEELRKATINAGFELSSHYEGHSRQAAQTIMNATAAVPSQANSPEGARLVIAGIREAAQQNIDLYNYKQPIYSQGGDLVKADTDFYNQNPAQMYARRAISTIKPYEVNNPQQFNRYLPGTYVTVPTSQGGRKLVQVPMRPGAPPIPDYLQGGGMQTAQQ